VSATCATIRAFVALELDADSLRRTVQVADRLRLGSGAPNAAWTPPEKMHVTLKFAGDLALEAVDALSTQLASLASCLRGPRPCASRLGAFPTVQSARIVILELEDSNGELGELATRVDELLSSHGIPREERPFRAHVTLARLKRPFDARRWLTPDPAAGAGDCAIGGLTLFRSQLSAAGSSYTPLARFAFQTASTHTS
jgi:2'-5' RNA ligase